MTHPRLLSVVFACSPALVLGAGCWAPSHDLGDTPDGPTPELVPPPVAVEAAPPQASFISEFEGVWLGEVEDPLGLDGSGVYHFPSGSTRILIDLRSVQSRSITFGDGPSLPPPTDPDVGYPPNAESYLIASGPMPPWEGYPYPVWGAPFNTHDLFAIEPRDFYDPQNGERDREIRLDDEGRVIDGLLMLQYNIRDLFRPWCALQDPESYCGGENLHSAGLAVNYEEDTCANPETDEPMDCGKAYLCYLHCRQLDNADGYVLPQLELRFSADGLVGVFSQGAVFTNERGFLTPVGPVHFHRVE